MKYLIWAQRRRAARTCRGSEPRWPGWRLLGGSSGSVWWERMRSRCCSDQPYASRSRKADLRNKNHTCWSAPEVKPGDRTIRNLFYSASLYRKALFKRYIWIHTVTQNSRKRTITWILFKLNKMSCLFDLFRPLHFLQVFSSFFFCFFFTLIFSPVLAFVCF